MHRQLGEKVKRHLGDRMDKAFIVGLMIGIAALVGTIGMGIATARSVDIISRKRDEYPKIRRAYKLALIIETVIIIVMLIAILYVFL